MNYLMPVNLERMAAKISGVRFSDGKAVLWLLIAEVWGSPLRAAECGVRAGRGMVGVWLPYRSDVLMLDRVFVDSLVAFRAYQQIGEYCMDVVFREWKPQDNEPQYPKGCGSRPRGGVACEVDARPTVARASNMVGG